MIKKFLTQTSLVLAAYLLLPLCLMSAEEDIRCLGRAAGSKPPRYSMSLPVSDAIINPVSNNRDSINTLLDNEQLMNIESLEFAATDPVGENSIPQKPSALFSLTNALGSNGPLRTFIQENKPLRSLKNLYSSTTSKKMKIDFQTTLAVDAPLDQSGLIKFNLDLVALKIKKNGAIGTATKNLGSIIFNIPASVGIPTTPWDFYESQLSTSSRELAKLLRKIPTDGSLFLKLTRENDIAGNYPALVQVINMSISSRG